MFLCADIVELRKNDGVEIRIKCDLDAHGRKVVDDFLKERNLHMRQEEGYIVVYQ
jgi:hypothetical protein